MSKETALQFAEGGKYSQVRAFAGEILYTEGMPAAHMYVIKDGEIDLYLVRDEKRTVVETLKKGQCFGIEPHLANQFRTHNAAARTYCELFLIDNKSISTAIGESPSLVQSMLDTLSERLSVAHKLIATRINYQPDLVIYARLLYLLGIADIGKSSVSSRGAVSGKEAVPARPLLQDVFTNARMMFGHSDKHIQACLSKLMTLHIIRVEDGPGGKQVIFSPKDIVSQVSKVVANDIDNDKLSYEYVSVDEFAALVEVERGLILKKLAGGEFADDIFTFRRAEILRLLNEKGKRFFAERKIKSPAEFSDIQDLDFADQKSLFTAVAKIDTFVLAKVLYTLEEGPLRAKILSTLSARRREEVESELKDMKAVDPMEVQQVCMAIVSDVKELMLRVSK